MKSKAVDVKPFVETYKVYDKINQCILIESESIFELYTFIMERSPYIRYGYERISYTLKEETPVFYDYRIRAWVKYDAPKYVIVDRYNVPVPKEVIHDALYANRKAPRTKHKENFCKNLIKRKKSAAKIKHSYRTVPYMQWRHGLDKPYICYTFPELSYFRKPSTMKEMRKACADIEEYGQNIVRAKRNHKNLPNSYDDIYCNIHDTKKSWKHNSKRRKQWKPL